MVVPRRVWVENFLQVKVVLLEAKVAALRRTHQAMVMVHRLARVHRLALVPTSTTSFLPSVLDQRTS
jgi:hypothetical protein